MSQQIAIVHLVRAALRYVSTSDSAAVLAGLKQIYQAASAQEAEQELANFASRLDEKYPTISKQWRAKWPHCFVDRDLANARRTQ